METKPSHYEQYTKYADALRNWLIVYGVGGIALLYSQDTQIDKKKIGKIAIALLIAVFSQVMIAFGNKWYNLVNYMGEINTSIGSHDWYKKVMQYKYAPLWINIAADIVSLVAFLYATYFLIKAFT